MRISNLDIFQRASSNMMEVQRQLARTQEQLSLGKRILSPADDPVAAAQIVNVNAEKARLEQYSHNITTLDNRLELMDGSLGSITESLQRVRELAVQTGDGALTLRDRQSLAQEVQERLQEIVSYMNTRDASDEYVFAGFQGETAPFQKDGSGHYQYLGDEGQRFVQVGAETQVPMTENGRTIFVDIQAAKQTFFTAPSPTNTSTPPATIDAGQMIDQAAWDAVFPEDFAIEFRPLAESAPPGQANFTVRSRSDNQVVAGLQNVTYVAGTTISFNGIAVSVKGTPQPGDVFNVESSRNQSVSLTLERFIEGLNKLDNNPTDRATLGKLISDSLGNLDQAIDSIGMARSRVGARMNVSETAKLQNENVALLSTKTLSQLEDLDYAEATTRLTLQNVVLQAAQQSFVKVSNLSLFNFLR